MTKAENHMLWKLQNEYILLNELHQLLVNFGRTALNGGGLCGLSSKLQCGSTKTFDSSIFRSLKGRIRRDLKTVRTKAYGRSVWLFPGEKPQRLFPEGRVKPRIKWLENEMAEVEKEAKKLLSHG
jgi:hypothetical protein